MTTNAGSDLLREARRRAADTGRHGFNLLRFIWAHPEVRGHRGRAIVRALTWQAWQRVIRRPWSVRLSPSIALLCYPHSTAAASVLYCGYPEWREMHFLVDILRPGDHFVDVGANVGVYTLLASTVPEVEIWALEPSSTAADRLAENIRRNGLEKRCHALQTAVGRTSGNGYLTVALGTMNRTTGPSSDGSIDPHQVEPIAIVRLDDAIPASVHPGVAVIKIDVEGDETSVLEGATTLLSSSNAVLIIENNHPDELFALLTGQGYEPCTYDPDTHQLTPAYGALPNQANCIYVSDIDAARRRLTNLCHNRK